MLNSLASARAALVVSHPSHELRVHGWLELARPRVLVLTDGSGRAGQPRLAATTKVLSEAGAEPGSIYGRISDLDFYAAILKHDFSFFIKLAGEIARDLRAHEIEYVVGDAAEGYVSTHDVCRLLIDAAVELLKKNYDYQILNFDFPVVGAPEKDFPASKSPETLYVELDEAMFARKIAAARGYDPQLAADIEAALSGAPFRGVGNFSVPKLEKAADADVINTILDELRARPDLLAKYRDVFDGFDLDASRLECLRAVGGRGKLPGADGTMTYYEVQGEKLAAAGRVKQAIRYREHLLPLAEALWNHVETNVV